MQNTSVHLVILFCALKLVDIVFLANKLWYNNNYHSLDNFAELVETFFLALHHHCNTEGHSL